MIDRYKRSTALQSTIILFVVCMAFVIGVQVVSAASAPKKVRALQATEVKKRGVTISWNTRSRARYYTVQLRDSDNDVIKRWKKFKKSTKKVKRRHGHLRAGTEYNFRVRACNAAGCGKWSKKKTFTTKVAATETEDTADVDVAILALEADVNDAINAYRTEHALVPFSYSDDMATIAREHSANMASGVTDFGHDGAQGRYQAIAAVIDGWRGGAENVAYLSARDGIAQAAADGWIASEGHRHNIENAYTVTGVGVAFDSSSNRYYFTQVFAQN